ncbi:MAG TPA: DUF2612 domain-containing protein [Candidatus Sulfotelmatobacter sp.]|nr:DUF2612 domain-containing protein [Candidatus Sulfotelmatobacter sp.]
MTTDELLAYYANLLPAQYRTQANAVQTIETLAALALMPQGGNVMVDGNGDPMFNNGQLVVDSPYGLLLPLAVAQAFNIATAEGQQLQFLAQQIGAKNSGFNLSGEFVTLADPDFRLLLQAAGARKFMRATGANIDTFLNQFFSNFLTITDNLNMHVSYTYTADLGSKNWAELFITQGFLPTPLAVGYTIIRLPAVGPYFGFQSTVQQAPSWVSGLCSAADPRPGIVLNTNDLIIL